MAFIQMSLMSKALMRTVPVNVILPADKLAFPGMPERGDRPYKTLYLLHGVFGSSVDWVNGTRIQRFAEENDLAVVMPSGDNAFYVDDPVTNNNYGEFVGEELVELTRKIFHLSHRREDTYIGGLSMGGYGAIRNGLKYHDRFGAIVALSSALHVTTFRDWTNDSPLFIERRDYAQALFGDFDEVLTSDKNPEYLIRKLVEQGAQVPDIYMACGDQDFLLAKNQEFVDFVRAQGLEVTFEVGPGGHEWDFWDTYIRKALEKNGAGISSGNVGI